MLTVITDMDGVFCDLLATWLEQIHKNTGEILHPEDIVTWNLQDSPAVQKLGLDKKTVYEALNSHTFNNAPPYISVVPSFLKLNQLLETHNGSFYILTRPSDTDSIVSKARWITKYFGPSWDKKVIYGHDKWLVKGDIFIDDNIDTCCQYATYNPESVVLMPEHPYNKNDFATMPNNLIRIGSPYKKLMIVDIINAIKHVANIKLSDDKISWNHKVKLEDFMKDLEQF